MLRPKSIQNYFYSSYIYDRAIPEDNFLGLLDRAVDFSFVNELGREAYTPEFGRPAYVPEMMFTIFFLQFLYDISDHGAEKGNNFNLIINCFVGLAIYELSSGSSSLNKF